MLTRREVVVEVCELLRFFVLCVDKEEYLQTCIQTNVKEAGSYRCLLDLTRDSLSITLQAKKSRTRLHSIYLKYDYMGVLSNYGWYINSTPYNRGKRDILTTVSTYTEVLGMDAFELVTYAVFKDQQLRALHKTLLEWKREYVNLLVDLGLTLDLTGSLRNAKII